MRNDYDTVTPTNPHTRREMREIAGTSIGIIIITIVFMFLGRSILREKTYTPTEAQQGIAEEAVQRR